MDESAQAGQSIRFQLPISQQQDAGASGTSGGDGVTPSTALPIAYDKIAWVRCLGQDMKLHWVKQDDEDKDGEAAGKVWLSSLSTPIFSPTIHTQHHATTRRGLKNRFYMCTQNFLIYLHSNY